MSAGVRDDHEPPDHGVSFDPTQLCDIGEAQTKARILSLFLDQAGERCSQLQEAIAGEHDDTLRNLAHGLKGSAATVGAVRISELCDELCHRAAGHGIDQRVAEIHQLLVVDLAEAGVTIHRYIEGIT
jgi:HPt (histidine-containing phosphotransfer) domain-containing protein